MQHQCLRCMELSGLGMFTLHIFEVLIFTTTSLLIIKVISSSEYIWQAIYNSEVNDWTNCTITSTFFHSIGLLLLSSMSDTLNVFPDSTQHWSFDKERTSITRGFTLKRKRLSNTCCGVGGGTVVSCKCFRRATEPALHHTSMQVTRVPLPQEIEKAAH